jgi:hypothetical protein
MAITFTKDTNGKVIVDDGTRKFSLDSSMNVLPHISDTELIIITDSSAPLEQREVLKFGWQQVTTPANSSRNDLIEKLGKLYFYPSFSASVSFPPGLATEAKQDSQIALATLLNGYVDGLESLLTTLNGKDFATETTLVQIKGFVDGIETLLGTIGTNTTGLNLEATQLLIKGVLDLIKAKTDNLDVALSTRATEATLIQVRDYLDTLETKLQAIYDELYSQSTFGNSYSGLPFVAANAASVTLIGQNLNRKEVYIRNTSNQNLHIRLAAGTATIPTPIMLKKDEILIEDRYTGEIRGIWESPASSGGATIMEVFR